MPLRWQGADGGRGEERFFTMKALGLLLLLGLRLGLGLTFELCLGLVIDGVRLGAVAFGLGIRVVDEDNGQRRGGSIKDRQVDGQGKGSPQSMFECSGHCS
jgi:hypothetical protein